MYLLGTGVRGASRLIDPRNPPRHQGVGAPPYLLASSQALGAQLILSRHYRVGI